MAEKKHTSNSSLSSKAIHKDREKDSKDGEEKNGPLESFFISLESLNTEKDPTNVNATETEKNISQSLVRLRKTIVYHENDRAVIDSLIVNPGFYNAFDCSSIPEIFTQEKFVLGVTSPEIGDGKTLAAANLAVSIAMSQKRETVLVDFNIGRPKLHRVFDVPLMPGLLDALSETVVHVSRTNVRHLSVMTAGNLIKSFEAASLTKGNHPLEKSTISLEHLSDFRNLIYSLEKEFDLVIVDFPSIQDSGIPSLFAKQLDGIVVVVNAGKTKKENLDQILFHLNTSNVVGFIFNRATKDNIVM
jgi:Mrp family chromosome partitioning ATPase